MKKKILLVDDDDAVRRMLGRLLADEDYVVIPANDACMALKTAAAKGVDLVLLDLNSPAEVRQMLEEFTRENPHLPVIVTTRSHQVSRTPISGGAALMEKPLDLPKLLRTISTLLATA